MSLQATSNHMYWLSVMRGLNIVLVVMYHVQLIDFATGNNHIICEQIPSIFTPVRMPFFIFSSGGLLFLSRINKNWNTKDLYWDKFQRIIIPFLFFVTFYFLFKVMLNGFVKTPVEVSFSYYFESFIYYPGHPSAPLWFLATLSTMMFLYPLFKVACKSDVLMVTFLILSIVIFYLDTSNVSEIFNLSNLNHYLIFFFFGIFFFKYKLHNYLSSNISLLLTIVVYVLLFYIEKGLFTSLSGIVMMCAIGKFVARYFPKLFSSFRDNIFQIYLMSFIFQAFVELVLWKKLFYNENLFWLFYVMNITAGVFCPILVTKLVNRCPQKIVRLCFGLK